MYHNGKYISSKPLFYDLNDKNYKSQFWASKSGDIAYVVKINMGLESYEVNTGKFKVQESHIELNKIFLNKDKLISLSNSSDGSFRNWVKREDIIEDIKDRKKIQSYSSLFAFRYNYFYISLIIFLLSVEWFYRRSNGMI